MAILRSTWALLNRTATRPIFAGHAASNRFFYEFTAASAANDIIDLGVLPAGATVTRALIFTEGVFAAATADVGIMSGEIGSTDGGRTCGNEIFAAADLVAAGTAAITATKPAAFLIAPATTDRSIGCKVSAIQAAASGKKVHLILEYTQ